MFPPLLLRYSRNSTCRCLPAVASPLTTRRPTAWEHAIVPLRAATGFVLKLNAAAALLERQPGDRFSGGRPQAFKPPVAFLAVGLALRIRGRDQRFDLCLTSGFTRPLRAGDMVRLTAPPGFVGTVSCKR